MDLNLSHVNVCCTEQKHLFLIRILFICKVKNKAMDCFVMVRQLSNLKRSNLDFYEANMFVEIQSHRFDLFGFRDKHVTDR